MYLPNAEEWGKDSQEVKGMDVYHAGSGRVREEWLSRCEEERALTGDLMSEVLDLSNLLASMKRVITNGGSSGVDGMEVKELPMWFTKNKQTFIESLETNSYKVSLVRGVEIPKPKGGYRQLGIPTVKDRLVQQAIHQILEKRYDPIFSASSYGFRRGKSAHAALAQAGEYVKSGLSYVVDIDLAKFFDEVNHDRLLKRLSQRIGDKQLLQLIGKYLRSGMFRGGLTNQRIKGTPQGSPLSPLLSNIVLDELDKELERRGLKFVRYADDMIIFVGSLKAAERVQSSITEYIETHLKLKVNSEKSGIRRPHELNFLGHRILNRGELGLSASSHKRLKHKLKEQTSRNRGISLKQLITELNPILRGWLNYFKGAKMKGKLKVLMSWLRRRLRCFRLKQCKRAIGISRFLRKLGVPKWRSWLLALSSKGWYHKSNTPQSHEGMNLEWFAELGLFDMYDYYCSKLMKPPST